MRQIVSACCVLVLLAAAVTMSNGENDGGAEGWLDEFARDATDLWQKGEEKVRSWFQNYWVTKHSRRRNPNDWPPKFCKGYECPRFAVLNDTQDYEVRLYNASNWVSTQLLDSDFDTALHTMFRRLFNYITGANAESKKIPMTVPVTVQISRSDASAVTSFKKNFTMSFYLTNNSNPAPNEANVTLTKLPQTKVYVRSFPGYYVGVKAWLKEAQKLEKTLERDSQTFHKTFLYTVGYDSPFTFFNRHNEIWFIAK